MARKVSAGDPLRPSAAVHNATLELIERRRAGRHNIGAGGHARSGPDGAILARNDSGAGRDRFDILGVDGPIVNVTENAAEFESRVSVVGVAPEEKHRGRFVVLLEPLPGGLIGRACLFGACVARVKMLSEAHQFADVAPGESSMLHSGGRGAAHLAWVQPVEDRDDPEIAWTIARLGVASTSTARARVTGYRLPGYTHYVGRLIDADGADIDPDGDPVELHCRKGVPDTVTDIRGYLPRLLATDFVDTIWDVRWVDEEGGRWYIEAAFSPWCEEEGVPGHPPGFPVVDPFPQEPGDPHGAESIWWP